MSLIRWNPDRDLTFPGDILDMQRGINRMFDRFFRGGLWEEDLVPSTWSPEVDIGEEDGRFVVKVELPGVDKANVKITTQDNILTIRGEKKQERESKGSNYHRVERSYGSFQRSFSLPSSVKNDKIEASFSDGVLSVALPKAEEAKRKAIEVKIK